MNHSTSPKNGNDVFFPGACFRLLPLPNREHDYSRHEPERAQTDLAGRNFVTLESIRLMRTIVLCLLAGVIAYRRHRSSAADVDRGLDWRFRHCNDQRPGCYGGWCERRSRERTWSHIQKDADVARCAMCRIIDTNIADTEFIVRAYDFIPSRPRASALCKAEVGCRRQTQAVRVPWSWRALRILARWFTHIRCSGPDSPPIRWRRLIVMRDSIVPAQLQLNRTARYSTIHKMITASDDGRLTPTACLDHSRPLPYQSMRTTHQDGNTLSS